MSDASAASKCAAGTLRRASRSITRVYDARLSAAGLSSAQFSMLRAIESHDGSVLLSELAEELVFERTSLYRSLDLLVRDGLITVTSAGGRARKAKLTAKGVRRIAQALPMWAQAQQEFLDRFGRAVWNVISAQLADIVDIARAMPESA